MAPPSPESATDVLSPNFIPIVDVRLFSQPELLSFSAASSSCDFCRFEEDLVLKIDRSSFQESAGSRRQTYSGHRLASRKPELQLTSGSVSRRSIVFTHNLRATPAIVEENKKIVECLSDLFGVDDRRGELFSIDIEYEKSLSNVANMGDSMHEVTVDVIGSPIKRKRSTETNTGRHIYGNNFKNKVIRSCGYKHGENAMKTDDVIDFISLANVEGSSDSGLRTMTVGLKTKPEFFEVGLQFIWPRKSLKGNHDQVWLTSNSYTSVSSFLCSDWGFQGTELFIYLRTNGYAISVYDILRENESQLAFRDDDGEKNGSVKSCFNIQNGNHIPLKVSSARISADQVCSVMFFSKDAFLNHLQCFPNKKVKVRNFDVRNCCHYNLRNCVENILKVIKGESRLIVKKLNNLYFMELSHMDFEAPVLDGIYYNIYKVGTESKSLENFGQQNTGAFMLVQQYSEGWVSIDEIVETLCHFLRRFRQ